MKEALERIDSGLLFVLLGYEPEGTKLIAAMSRTLKNALQVELCNVTLPGEGEKAARLQSFSRSTSHRSRGNRHKSS